MKKQTLAIAIMFSQSILIWSQNTINSSPCTETIAQTTKGDWVKQYDNAGSVTSNQKQESYKRLDILHQILLKMYPQPIGLDIRESRSAGIGYFGATRKYTEMEDGSFTYDYVKKLPIISYGYFANFSPHYCAHTNDGIVFMSGKDNENSNGISININDFGGLISDPVQDDDWTINGLPIRIFNTMISESWKGYEIYGDVRSHGGQILLHRNGMLPYIPVTRKQYLERCIVKTTQLYDKIIALNMRIPVRSLEEQEIEKNAKLAKFQKDFGSDPKQLKSAVDYYLSGYKTDQQILEERLNEIKKNRDNELKIFKTEMEKSSKEESLDSPAKIVVMYTSAPVFENDPKKASMLVTENPDYFRKDLQSHIPQFMVLQWNWSNYLPHQGYEKMFLQDFPIEKLQAMIDK